MAIMQSCCCFSSVRSGSTACGIYSLITSCIYLAITAFNLAQYVNAFTTAELTGPLVDGIYAVSSLVIIFAAFLIIASIVLLVGVSQDDRTMLIPYMVAITALMSFQAIAWMVIFVSAGAVSGLLSVTLVVWLLFTALNITCLICVISQYQELSEGRGRANGVA